MWNATKFCLFRMGMMDLDGHRQPGTFVPNATSALTGKESLAEKWILHKLNQTAIAVDASLESRDFFEASNAAYKFFLNELCDVYIVSRS
jgi:valyl-tRNA synthetase